MSFLISKPYDKVSPLGEVLVQLNKEPLLGAHLITVDLPADANEHSYPHFLGKPYRAAWPGALSDVVSCSQADPTNPNDSSTVRIRNLSGRKLTNIAIIVI